MDIKSMMMWASGLLGIILFLPLILGILKNKIEQSFATWILWLSLDLIALISIMLQKGNYSLLVLYVIGSATTAFILICKKQFKWTRFETFVTFLVLVCIGFWYTSGPRWATISSSIAVVISGLPQIKDSWNKPDRTTGLIYIGYVFTNTLFFFSGKNWTIEDRFYPGMMVPLCIAIAFSALHKRSESAT